MVVKPSRSVVEDSAYPHAQKWTLELKPQTLVYGFTHEVVWSDDLAYLCPTLPALSSAEPDSSETE